MIGVVLIFVIVLKIRLPCLITTTTVKTTAKPLSQKLIPKSFVDFFNYFFFFYNRI